MIDDLRGVPVGDYILQEKIGEGSFAVVYLAVNRRSDEPRAFKIARNEVNQVDSNPGHAWTQALMHQTGNIGTAPVSPALFLSKQFEYLKEAGESLYPRVDGLMLFEAGAAMQMEFLEGLSLRELMLRNEVTDEAILRLAATMVAHERQCLKHGDLKPENIFVTGERVALLDPGFFGEFPLSSGISRVMITTPQYYPLLEPDDMMAFGLILLELATGVRLTRGAAEGPVGPGLAAKLQQLHLGNNYYFDSISQISRAGGGAELLAASPLQPVILKALGLGFDPGRNLDLGDRYPGFEALESDLRQLLGAQDVSSPGVAPADSLQTEASPAAPGNLSPEAFPFSKEAECYHCEKPLNGESTARTAVFRRWRHCVHAVASR